MPVEPKKINGNSEVYLRLQNESELGGTEKGVKEETMTTEEPHSSIRLFDLKR
jgi:hypothetical protein